MSLKMQATMKRLGNSLIVALTPLLLEMQDLR